MTPYVIVNEPPFVSERIEHAAGSIVGHLPAGRTSEGDAPGPPTDPGLESNGL